MRARDLPESFFPKSYKTCDFLHLFGVTP